MLGKDPMLGQGDPMAEGVLDGGPMMGADSLRSRFHCCFSPPPAVAAAAAAAVVSADGAAA